MTDLKETCKESKAAEIIWSMSDVSNGVLSTAALKMLWASCGKAKQSTVYGFSSLCQSSSIKPSILFCFLLCQPSIRPPFLLLPPGWFWKHHLWSVLRCYVRLKAADFKFVWRLCWFSWWVTKPLSQVFNEHFHKCDAVKMRKLGLTKRM